MFFCRNFELDDGKSTFHPLPPSNWQIYSSIIGISPTKVTFIYGYFIGEQYLYMLFIIWMCMEREFEQTNE